jgi:hypothetical protein
MRLSGSVQSFGCCSSHDTYRRGHLVGGGILLFGYGALLNFAPVPFERVVGLYIATLFCVWQVVAFATFRTLPSIQILVGGALIVTGGLVVTSGSGKRQLRRPYFRGCSRASALYRSIWPASLDQLEEIFLRTWA